MKNFIYFSILFFFTFSLLSCNSSTSSSKSKTSTTKTSTTKTNKQTSTTNNNNNNNRNPTSRNTQSRDLFSVQCACHTNAAAIPVYGQGFTRESAIEDARKDCQSISSNFTILPNTCTVQIYFVNN